MFDGGGRKQFKYRVAFQGNNVVGQVWGIALFQDPGSSPALNPSSSSIPESSQSSGTYSIPPNTRCEFNQETAIKSGNSNDDKYPVSNAFSSGLKYTRTEKGIYQWW